GKEELDVGAGLAVVRELVRSVVPQAQAVGLEAERDEPVVAGLAPVLVPGLRLLGRNEELHLHLLELTGAGDEVLGHALDAERLAPLGAAEGGTEAARVDDVPEVDEDPLRGLGAKIDDGALVLDGAHVR